MRRAACTLAVGIIMIAPCSKRISCLSADDSGESEVLFSNELPDASAKKAFKLILLLAWAAQC